MPTPEIAPVFVVRMIDRLNETPGTWIVGLAVGLAVVTAIAVVALVRLRRVERRLESALGGSDGDLEETLRRHMTKWADVDAALDAIRDRVAELERRDPSSKRYFGFVRYDAYDDASGELSFSVALYDERGDGAVLTGLTGRSESRLYCKRLEGGEADRPLTPEEERALHQAVERHRSGARRS